MDAAHTLDLAAHVTDLTAAVCDIESVSGDEGPLADAVEVALRKLEHLEVTRDGNCVVARTHLGRPERVVLAGHLDTVPLSSAGNLPTWREQGADGVELWGRGTVDMKGGVAVQLRLAAQLAEPNRDLTFIFYDCEEVESQRNGLRRLAATTPELLTCDFAVLLEPTGGLVEGGCKGTMRADIRTSGVAAHSGRPWLGTNAIHAAAPVLKILAEYQAREVDVDGLVYREGLSAVGIRGGAGNNVIPDECVVTVNYRFAPDRDESQAETHVREIFDGYDVVVTDMAGGARPGLHLPLAQAFVAAIGGEVAGKQGWTDVARFASLGIPAVNYGPGDPLLCHKDDEHCPVEELVAAEAALLRWLE
ncbi:succinyl-diaminopimelate desuccinylase [Gephyromycinifex aptenodytis]|uniref:succinyl-diaminopimelate desuccinylase n=1 Tax=Gephyromycinifex aptenodytis TaxID=2716227 RepID=UPI001445BBCF|nr:succinyl-diaminopimelate desuccinylase [Gephyromycinifex aptenodytis]